MEPLPLEKNAAPGTKLCLFDVSSSYQDADGMGSSISFSWTSHKRKRKRNQDHLSNVGSGTNHVFANAVVPLMDTLKCCKHEDDDPEVAFIGESTSDYNNKQLMKFGKCFDMPLKDHFSNVGSGTNHVFANAAVPLMDTLKCCKHEDDDLEVAFIGESTSDYKNKQLIKFGKCFDMPLKDHFSNVDSGTNHVFANAANTVKCCKHEDDNLEVAFIGESTSDYNNKQLMKFGKCFNMPLKDHSSNVSSGINHVFANADVPLMNTLKCCKHEDDDPEVAFIGESTLDYKNKQPMKFGKGFNMPLKDDFSNVDSSTNHVFANVSLAPKDNLESCKHDDDDLEVVFVCGSTTDYKNKQPMNSGKGFDMALKDDFSNLGFGTKRFFDNVDFPLVDTLKCSKPESQAFNFAEEPTPMDPSRIQPEVVVNVKKPSRIQPEVVVTVKKPTRIQPNVGGNGKKPNKVQRKLVVDERRPTRKPRKRTRIQPEVVADERRPIVKSKKPTRAQPKAMDDEKKPTRTQPKAVVDEKKPTTSQPDKGFDMPLKDDFSNMGFGMNHVLDNADLPPMDTLKSSKPASQGVNFADGYDYYGYEDGYYEGFEPNYYDDNYDEDYYEDDYYVDENYDEDYYEDDYYDEDYYEDDYYVDENYDEDYYEDDYYVDENYDEDYYEDDYYDEDYYEDDYYDGDNYEGKEEPTPMDPSRIQSEVVVNVKKRCRIQPKGVVNVKKPTKIQPKVVVKEKKPTGKSQKPTRIQSNMRVSGKKPIKIQPKLVVDERRPTGKSTKTTEIKPKAVVDEKKPTRTRPKAEVDEKKPIGIRPKAEVDEKKPMHQFIEQELKQVHELFNQAADNCLNLKRPPD